MAEFVGLCITLLVNCSFIVVCWVKGKRWLAAAGLAVPLIAWIGALRLAKPDSWWAARYYGHPRMDEASARYPGREPRSSWAPDAIGDWAEGGPGVPLGAPSLRT